MTTEDYVSFKAAKLLKEKGFDLECDYLYVDGEIRRAQGYACNWNSGETILSDYVNECSAPTLQMVMKWLREKHNIYVEVRITNHSFSSLIAVPRYYWIIFNAKEVKWMDESTAHKPMSYETVEEACESAIKYCLENLI